MSTDVTNLCRPLLLRSTSKCVLMALADRADDSGLAWPSIPWLCTWTCFSRTAVIGAKRALENEGLVLISKEIGRNDRCVIDLDAVKVRVAKQAADGAELDNEYATAVVPDPYATRTGTGTPDARVGGEEEGAQLELDPCVSRTGVADAPVLQTDGYPCATRTPPVRQTHGGGTADAPYTSDTSDTSLRQTRARKKSERKKSALDAMAIELPDWLPADAWAMWCKYRSEIKKAMTEDTVRLQLRRLSEYQSEGHDARLVIEHSIENSWQSVYPSKDGRTLARNAAIPATDGPGGQWWAKAGFLNAAHAGNFGCYAHTAHQFRAGERIEVEHA
jgi:hypothetical protein